MELINITFVVETDYYKKNNMKTISVQQPWASLICAGIKDIENRTWKPKENPGRILIHASKKAPKTILDKIPVEWASSILNNQTFGNIPYFEDMPSNAIIGYEIGRASCRERV